MKTWIFLCLLIFAGSCTIQKRHFRKGYTIDWKKNNRSNSIITPEREVVAQAEPRDVPSDFIEEEANVDEIVGQDRLIAKTEIAKSLAFSTRPNQIHTLVKKQLTHVKQYTKGAADELVDDDLRFRHKSASTKMFALAGVTLVGACLFALGSATVVPIPLMVILFGVSILLFVGGMFKYLKFYRQSDPNYQKSDKELKEDDEFRKKQEEKTNAMVNETKSSDTRGNEVGLSIALSFIVAALVLVAIGVFAIFVGGWESIVLLYFLGIGALVLVVIGIILAAIVSAKNAGQSKKQKSEIE